MKIDIPQKLMLELAMLPVEQQVEWINNCLPRDQLLIDAAFEAWHARGQMEPHEQQWRVWLMMAGRGFGKTRAGAEWVHQLASRGKVRIALVGASIDEGRAIMVEGPSGLLSVARRQRQRLKWEPSLGRLTWPRGGVAQLFSGDHADGLRGPEHHFAWCDELAKWRQAEEAWDNLQMGLRAGPMPRALVTTTPRPMPLLERLKADPRTKVTNGATSKNLNLPRFIAPWAGLTVFIRSDAVFGVYRAGAWEIGQLRGSAVLVGGQQVVASRRPAIASPAGGTTVDTEGRAAVGQILAALRQHGLIEP